MAKREIRCGGVIAVTIAAVFALGACGHGTHGAVVVGDAPDHYESGHDHGPPPHAPAHGYRRKHRDAHRHGELELVFDSGLGVYVVVGFPSHYWLDGAYYRERSGSFEIAASIDGPWRSSASVPPGLAGKAKGKAPNAKGNGKGHRRGNANQD